MKKCPFDWFGSRCDIKSEWDRPTKIVNTIIVYISIKNRIKYRIKNQLNYVKSRNIFLNMQSTSNIGKDVPNKSYIYTTAKGQIALL